jgi:hypothetical protein
VACICAGTFRLKNVNITKVANAYFQANAIKLPNPWYFEATDATTIERISDDVDFNPSGTIRFCSRVPVLSLQHFLLLFTVHFVAFLPAF